MPTEESRALASEALSKFTRGGCTFEQLREQLAEQFDRIENQSRYLGYVEGYTTCVRTHYGIRESTAARRRESDD